MALKEIVLVRHFSTALSERGILQGTLDPPLNPDGFVETDDVGERLARLTTPGGLLLTSPLRRAIETARALERFLMPLKVLVLDELRELDFGRWQGRTEDELLRQPFVGEAYTQMWPDYEWGGGETLERRAAEAAQSILTACSAEGSAQCVVVSHGFLLQAVASRFVRGNASAASDYPLSTGECILLVPDRRRWNAIAITSDVAQQFGVDDKT